MNTQSRSNLDFVEITEQLGRYDDTQEQSAALIRFLYAPGGRQYSDSP